MPDFKSRLAIVATAVLALGLGAARADTLKVAVPQKGNWDANMVDNAIKEGFFKEQGLDVETIYTQGGAPTLQAVISGSVDVAVATGLLGTLGAYVKGAPVRVISAEMTGSPDLFWYSRADSGIKTVKDMAGKTVGFSEPGSSSNLVILSLLTQFDVKAKPTPTGGVPDTMTQVMSGQVDVGWSVAPFGLAEVNNKTLNLVAHGNDATIIRNETIRINFANANTLATRRDAVVRFMKAYAKSLDWAYTNPKAIDYFAAGMRVTRPLAEEGVKDFYPKEAMQISEIKGLDTVLKQALEYKYIPKAMTADDVKGLFDIVYKPAAS